MDTKWSFREFARDVGSATLEGHIGDEEDDGGRAFLSVFQIVVGEEPFNKSF